MNNLKANRVITLKQVGINKKDVEDYRKSSRKYFVQYRGGENNVISQKILAKVATLANICRKNGVELCGALFDNKEHSIIMRYFDKKKVSREELEKLLDFENLTMEANTASEIAKLLEESSESESDPQSVIKSFVLFVRERSGSGEITWNDLIERLRELYLEDSLFGIRVQRFSKPAYWEIFFNHFDTVDYKDGIVKLTFDQEYYDETERENAYEFLVEHGIDTNEDGSIMSQVAGKWGELSEDERDDMISALGAIYSTHFVAKSRVDITNDEVKKITMTNADLVPEVGLRDYTITFKDGDMIGLRF